MTAKPKFNLGDRLRDMLTGIEGTATFYYFHLNGCQIVEFEPDPVDGKRSETEMLSEDRLELVTAAPAKGARKVPDIATCHIKLGDKVQDSLTRFTGHATIIAIPLFGVGRVAIEPTTITKEGKLADPLFFDEHRVEVVEKKAPPVAPQMTEERKKTRGCAPAPVSARVARREVPR
ncbi:hypothetical protein vBCbaSRXM_43 [Citromicrobium phage vB_CbaS-RXM]|nr:hypothetical protein vBCbaSRXM_43 [Citromicrobium phage vB_CbaS-RXM]